MGRVVVGIERVAWMGGEGFVTGLIRKKRRRRCDSETIVAGGEWSSWRRGSAWFGALRRLFVGGS